MKKHLLALLALGGLTMFPLHAFTPSVSLDCSGQNYCTANISGSPYDMITWQVDPGSTDAIYPIDCTNLDYCIFRCATQPGMVTASVYLWNNYQLVGYDSEQALCSEE